MPLQATSGAASYDAFGGGVAAVPNYIEECFATHLYTGNGSTQTITNGIDLAGKGGLVWLKSRSSAQSNWLWDTARGSSNGIQSNSTASQASFAGVSGFNSNGFNLGADNATNDSGVTFASWTFREQPKFFDVVTYTGDGSNARNIAHNLGAEPGFIIVKRTDTASNWVVSHRFDFGWAGVGLLNNTGAFGTPTSRANGFPSCSFSNENVFYVEGDTTVSAVNANGGTYVAYLFAHNAGGFGLTGTDNVISCGSFTTDGSGNATVNLGYEPQWIMYKLSSGSQNWQVADVMRGFDQSTLNRLAPNTSGAETNTAGNYLFPTATGFQGNAIFSASSTYIYIAIRRGPMRVPTTGTSVFAPALASSSGTYTATSNFPVDWAIEGDRASTTKFFAGTRLIGNATLQPNTTNAESAQSWGFDNMTGFTLPGVVGNYSGFINWMMRRAPGFFDVVCYTGTGVARTVAHNLAAVPELMIVKRRSTAEDWQVYSQDIGNTKYLNLNLNREARTYNVWNNTNPTASVFSLSADGAVNLSGGTFVTYLFATCPGVSKVFNFTGNGSSQTINCGFTGGARFVMIKRTDSTGDWYVWDTARGIVANNDPHLSLNTTAAEVTSNDTIDTDSTGFVVNQVSATNVNVNGASYIGLAIA
jgi:hypothetical protein